MSLTNNTAGGVKNLLAIFENKAADLPTSPPSRGRSPADSDTSAHNHPVSKVRASFISVEGPGEKGHQGNLRKASDISDMVETRGYVNGTADMGGENTQNETMVASVPSPSKAKQDESGSTKPVHFRHVSRKSYDGGLGKILKGSPFEPSSPEEKARGTQLETSCLGQPQDNLSPRPKTNGDTPAKTNGGSMVNKLREAAESRKTRSPPPTRPKAIHTAQPSKPVPIRQVHNSATSSPVLPRTPKTPASPIAHFSATKKSPNSEKRRVKTGTPKSAPDVQDTNGEINASQPETEVDEKQAKVNEVKKRAPTSPKTTRPKSPTRPVRLPVSFTAPTAASAAKIDTSHHPNGIKATTSPVQNKSRTTKVTKAPIESKAVTLKGPSKAPPVASTSSVARKTSRASLPVQTNGHDRPKARTSTASKPADEGFLSRMMRPTASTARKAHDKVQINSPPRGNKSATASRTKARKSMGTMRADDDKENKTGTAFSAEKLESTSELSKQEAETVQAAA